MASAVLVESRPNFLENAVQGKNVTIRGDGSDTLDFTYIEDLTQGVVKSIQNPMARGEVFNITAAKAKTIGEMAEMVNFIF